MVNYSDTPANIRTRYVALQIVPLTADVDTGTDQARFPPIPPEMAGMNLVAIHTSHTTAGVTGTSSVQIVNITQSSVDVLSTNCTIDSGALGSNSATTPAVINTGEDDVQEYDVYSVDVDAVHSGTAPKGLWVVLHFRFPA